MSVYTCGINTLNSAQSWLPSSSWDSGDNNNRRPQQALQHKHVWNSQQQSHQWPTGDNYWSSSPVTVSNDHRHQSPTISRSTKTNSLGCAQSSSTTTRCRKNAECNISCFICCSRWSSSPLNLLLSQWYGCGATLISCDPVIIVSAAHCFYGLVQRSPTNLIFSSQAENIVLVQHNDDAEMMMITIMMIRSADRKKWLKSKQHLLAIDGEGIYDDDKKDSESNLIF